MGMGVISHKSVKQGGVQQLGGNNNFLISTKASHVHVIDLKTKVISVSYFIFFKAPTIFYSLYMKNDLKGTIFFSSFLDIS